MSANFATSGARKVIIKMEKRAPKNEPVKPSSMFGGKANLFGSAKETDEWAELNKSPTDYADAEIMRILETPENYREFGGAL